MKKFAHIFFILFFSSCQILNKNKSVLPSEKNDITIYANAHTGEGESKSLTLKTKMILSKNSFLIQAYPIMGLKLGEIMIKNDSVYINQTITKTQQSIDIHNIDPTFKLKIFMNLIMQSQLKKDSVFYNNNYIQSVFTDYKYVDLLFLPSKIIYWEKEIANKDEALKKTIYLDYKSAKHSDR